VTQVAYGAHTYTGLAIQCLSKVGQLATPPVSSWFARDLVRRLVSRLVSAPTGRFKGSWAGADSMDAVQQLLLLAQVVSGQEALVECDAVTDILRWLYKGAEEDGSVSPLVEQACQVITAMLEDGATGVLTATPDHPRNASASRARPPSERSGRTVNERRGKSAVPSSRPAIIPRESNQSFLQNLVLIQEDAAVESEPLVSAATDATSSPTRPPETHEIKTEKARSKLTVQPLPQDLLTAGEQMPLDKGLFDEKPAVSPRVVYVDPGPSELHPEAKQLAEQRPEATAVTAADPDARQQETEGKRRRKSKSPQKSSIESAVQSDAAKQTPPATRPQAAAARQQPRKDEQPRDEQPRKHERAPDQRRPTQSKPTTSSSRVPLHPSSKAPAPQPQMSQRADRDSADTCLRACVNGYAGVHHTKCVNHEDFFQKVEAAQQLVTQQTRVQDQALVRAMAHRSCCVGPLSSRLYLISSFLSSAALRESARARALFSPPFPHLLPPCTSQVIGCWAARQVGRRVCRHAL
jgi:hypothetical protein